jgi:hypothetical protein
MDCIVHSQLALDNTPTARGILSDMKKNLSETQKAAQLLGRQGGMATLKKYGADKLREWGQLGAEHGKKGGRPPKSKPANTQKRKRNARAED